jgi:hypothetical protein
VSVISRTNEPNTGAAVVRGMPTRGNDLKEFFQSSVILAIAAAAGCNASSTVIDNGVDYDLWHEIPGEEEVLLRVQLKAVTNGWNASRTAISAKLRDTRYERMRRSGASIPHLLVIMDLPTDPASWVWSKHPYTAIRHCSYWVSLEGEPARSGDKVTVSAPAANVFDDTALCEIMARIRAGGRP